MKGGRETWAKVKKANLFPASPAVPERQTTHCPCKGALMWLRVHNIVLSSSATWPYSISRRKELSVHFWCAKFCYEY